jgi:2-phosphosulfolactate phosphatase
VIAALPGAASAEAAAARAAFVAARPGLPAALEDCVSGRELVEREFAQDVAIASELDVSGCAPALTGEGCFADAAPGVGPDDRQVPAADRG